MAAVLWVATIIVLVHAAHTYILLTANVDDVQAIAKQMLTSPVVDQIGKIWRRASAQFNQRMKRTKIQKRVDEDLHSDGRASGLSSGSEVLSDSFRRRGRRMLDDLSQLSKNASGYLVSLRRVFDEFTRDDDA